MKKVVMILMVLTCFVSGTKSLWALNLGKFAEAAKDGVKAVSISEADVVSMSKQAADYSDKNNPVAPDSSRYTRRLQGLVSRIRPEKGRTFNFKVYLVDEVNAFALADGSIRFYSSLMDMMDDDELFFVIGHELGHVMHGDSKATVRRAYTISAVQKGVAAQGGRAEKLVSSDVAGLLSAFITAKYSQKQEMAADDYGFEFMKRYGFKAGSSVTALKKLATLGGSHTFLSSHPDPAKRAGRLEKRLK